MNDLISSMLEELEKILGAFANIRIQVYSYDGVTRRYLAACVVGDGEGGVYEREFVGSSYQHALKKLLNKVRKDYGTCVP